jgi:threonine-phosphate decarboxylase
MIEGHGDDAYRYGDIRSDFSSNICVHGSHQALMDHLAAHPELVSHYPEPEAWSLEKRIAERHGLSPRQVIVTSGATEAIYLIAQTFRLRPVIPTPTFSEYEDACKLFPPTADDSMLWLCNPNNPTGEVYDQSGLDRLTAKYALTVIDQSYEHYTDCPVCCDSVAPTLLRIHSMTKTYGIPGLRLGYITAHEDLTEQLRHHLRPWSVSALAIEAGRFLLQHDEAICKPDLKEAQRLYERLSRLSGITVLPTHTNFMLCKLEHHTAPELKDYLAREHKMLIRDASNFRGLTPHHFRIASQTPEENDALVNAITDFFLND